MTTNLKRDYIDLGACTTYYSHPNKPFKFDGLFRRRLRKLDFGLSTVEIIEQPVADCIPVSVVHLTTVQA